MFRAARQHLLFALVCVAALAAPAGASVSRANHRAVATTALESQVLTQLNAIRAEHHLRPLRLSIRLARAAGQHSSEMAADGYFSHSSANGTAFWKRIQRYYSVRGYSYWAVGENLLWSSPDVSASAAVSMWMNSPEHRANILNGSWREIGLSAIHSARAPGVYGGRAVTVFTTDFGVRR